ncbi:class I SAM-dependent methyltransferase [Nocardioides dongkuii]|uniref:class I SAM-dependent methyltransferase n=1 Tax=Nocardioides dongkuii TaxID=2760089 RepID=UPI0015F98A27|nr:class I SAM-dependent methyltransferase [Nocardioides dongkuii]
MWSEIGADAYARFMGTYAEPLADAFVELADPRPGQRVLDVGCGPGTLTARLVDRLGADAVAAVDPSPPFVAAARERCPGADVREAAAEALPFADASYDAALAQLVVHFMDDPVAGLREMGRVVRDGGLVGACVWDERVSGPLAVFWAAASDVGPGVPDEPRAGTRSGHLVELCEAAGLRVEADTRLEVTARFGSFEDWWTPYTLGVGPAGQYVAGLAPAERDRLREACAARLPDGPFDVTAAAWTVLARA